MASYTTNLNLKKPADSESYDIANDNGNMDLIDAFAGTTNAAIASLNSKMTPEVVGITLASGVGGTISVYKIGNLMYLKFVGATVSDVPGWGGKTLATFNEPQSFLAKGVIQLQTISSNPVYAEISSSGIILINWSGTTATFTLYGSGVAILA